MKNIQSWNFEIKRKNLTSEKLVKKIVDRFRQHPQEKPLIDEQIWTFLMVYGYREKPFELFQALTGSKARPPKECLVGMEMMPFPVRKGSRAKGSEGNSYIDLMVGSIAKRENTEAGVQYSPTGPVCLVEAKWKSDISGFTNHDPHRNQLARVIETALTLQHHPRVKNDSDATADQESQRFPKKVHVTLLTPAHFRTRKPYCRFYAYKFWEYKGEQSGPRSNPLLYDIQHQNVEQRPDSHNWRYPDLKNRIKCLKLHWVSYEFLFRHMPLGRYKEALRNYLTYQATLPEEAFLNPNCFKRDY